MDSEHGLNSEGPCPCPACYVYGCDYCHTIGCVVHLLGASYFVPPTNTPIPIINPKDNPFRSNT